MNRPTASKIPRGIPMANSIIIPLRCRTANAQATTVTQNRTVGNQPETIEKPIASPSLVDARHGVHPAPPL
jgi:hypothetical protein